MGEWLFSAMFGSPGLKLTPLIIDCMIMIRIVWIANPWHLTRITNKMWKCHISTYFNYITDLFQSIICWFPCPIRGIKTVIFVDCLRLPWAMVHVQIMHLLMWPMHHCCWTLHLRHRSLHDGLQPSDLLSLLWQTCSLVETRSSTGQPQCQCCIGVAKCRPSLKLRVCFAPKNGWLEESVSFSDFFCRAC